MPNLLKLPNFYAFVAVFIVGCLAVTGSYTAGKRSERNKQAAETAAINSVIVEDRGKDEAEISAKAKSDAEVDDTVKDNLKQTFILDADTALWLGLVK
jgi:hypothetical protein